MLQWNDSYSIGNRELDEQHKKWISFYNKLDSAMAGGSHKDLLKTRAEILQDMSDYVDYHFNFEEEYMRSIGFPGVDKHWRMHKDFRDKIYHVCRNHNEGSILLNSEIMDTIKSWLLDHIIKQDVKIVEFQKSLK